MRSWQNTRTAAGRHTASVAALILLALAVQPAGADSPQAAAITVTVEGLRSQDGQLLVLLFDDARAFPMSFEGATEARKVTVDGTRVTFRIDDLPAGTYALSLIHDEDGDNELDTNLLGIPREGLGVSNNPGGGIPRFADAAFVVDGERRLTINLRYL